jgi:hypothetical protein
VRSCRAGTRGRSANERGECVRSCRAGAPARAEAGDGRGEGGNQGAELGPREALARCDGLPRACARLAQESQRGRRLRDRGAGANGPCRAGWRWPLRRGRGAAARGERRREAERSAHRHHVGAGHKTRPARYGSGPPRRASAPAPAPCASRAGTARGGGRAGGRRLGGRGGRPRSLPVPPLWVGERVTGRGESKVVEIAWGRRESRGGARVGPEPVARCGRRARAEQGPRAEAQPARRAPS